ncbi:hypothetical protein CCR75_006123 [Bremia lactucae]|uniref:PPPDE domain-containing protein n=1 Tax=Bremia lactucae TaxID=4779 RepID=A0A976IKG8_BRELC|nr:hypothetical protein CCR75_006123 [Bremia lactucae]
MPLVTLNVYDLSHGMALQLSPALLGKTIEGVWHSGILVYGKEYFFGGGGIQVMAPELVVQRYGMQPVRSFTLGETDRTLPQLEQFLWENHARFCDATYDLLRHNCNNFTDEVARFLVGTGIPKYILDLPNEALNSPFGAMLRPMLENMNTQMHAAPEDQLFSIPFNDASRATLDVPATVASTPTQASVNLVSHRFKVSGSPTLFLERTVQRIKTLNSTQLLIEAEISALNSLLVHVKEDRKQVNMALNIKLWKIIAKLLAQGSKSDFFFPGLCVFRVLLLQPPQELDAVSDTQACFDIIVNVTAMDSSVLSSAQKTVLLTVLLNAFANSGFRDMALSNSPRYLPFIFATITDSTCHEESRVLGAHIISNCCLAIKAEKNPMVTTIVCGAIETLDQISRLQSNTTMLQQIIEGIIIGLGRLLHNFEAARSLSIELGLGEIIQRLNVSPGLHAIELLVSEVVQWL